ncbi:16S rRNA (adenine(1518)-N(6)/adenine(1519)-N(6))-dimethyltransferase RsmA [Aestuariispira insulae]|uniref:Ribosomal RNA small subunit methyltransferase A n=1 Tax=Aestuariispira insulae TaxID=1461337 RepID=A0A3D9HVQ8_9PROT|nr:16S rRNA (adenine(1518)-N(6)/adenine(1519)-N(6))-dimethyltransferase RsmA [Aestuariispira insulae]RED53520.1 dimethyladenosine transferase [Aestuariispira insulae]
MSDSVANLPPLREIIAEHGLNAQKKLGQNFLLDLNLTCKIARRAGDIRHGTVIEVGPGPGGLTRALLMEGAANVVAIEKDPRCRPILDQISAASGGRLTMFEGDALTVDVTKLGDAPRRIVANLPYNVATPLLVGWLKQASEITSMTLMFQKEVAERIVAVPGDSAYSRLAVLANWRCDTKMEMVLPPRAFTPPPKVESAVVTLRPLETPRFDCMLEDLEAVTAAAFGQRRKMLRRSLKGLGVDTDALIDAAGITATDRAENLSVEEFATIAKLYREMRKDQS